MGRTAPTADNNTPPPPRIRRPRPADATGLSRLVYDSKASWGYGEVPSLSIPGRMLPRLEKEL